MMNLSEEISDAQRQVTLIQTLLVEEQKNNDAGSIVSFDDDEEDEIDLEEIDDEDLSNERQYLVEAFETQREEFLDEFAELAEEPEEFDRTDPIHYTAFLNANLFTFQKDRVSALCDLYASLRYAPVADRHRGFLGVMKDDLVNDIDVIVHNLSDHVSEEEYGCYEYPMHECEREDWAAIPQLRALISDTPNQAQKSFQAAAGRLLDDYLSVAVLKVREEIEFVAGYLFSCGDLSANSELVEHFDNCAALIEEFTLFAKDLYDPHDQMDLDHVLGMINDDFCHKNAGFRPH